MAAQPKDWGRSECFPFMTTIPALFMSRRLALSAAALAALFLFSACGGESKSSATAGGNGGSGSSATVAPAPVGGTVTTGGTVSVADPVTVQRSGLRMPADDTGLKPAEDTWTPNFLKRVWGSPDREQAN